MKIVYNVTMDDLVYFNRYHFQNSKAMRRVVLKTRLVFILVFIIAMMFVSVNAGNWYLFAPATALVCIVFILMSKSLMMKNIEKNVRRAYRECDNREMLGEQEIEMRDDGIFARGQASEGITFWRGISRIAGDEKYVFIYIGAVKAYVIRKSGVTSGNVDEFLEELEKRVKVT